MSMEQARRRAMWFNGCNRYRSNLQENETITTETNATVNYFIEKKKQQRTKEQIEEERLFYTSTR